MEPLISVVIPAYNRARTIIEALKSVQVQTYRNWEVVVVDDGSNDNTCQIVAEYAIQEPRVRLLRHEKNRGGQAARNSGIKAANGEWIAFLDSDDQFLPNSLSLRLAMAQRDNISVVHSGAYIQRKNEALQKHYVPKWSGNIYKKVLGSEGPVFPALLIKKEALEQIGYLDERVVAYQEWDTSIRLAKRFEFGFEPEPTFIYDYTSKDAISRSGIRNAKGYGYIMRKHFWPILFALGALGMACHYEVLTRWYTEGEDLKNAKRCQRIALIWKLSSPTIIYRKVKQLCRRSLAL